MRNLFKSKQLYFQPAEGIKAAIGLRFSNWPQQQPVWSAPVHTKASNPSSFLKLLSHAFILPVRGHFIIKELQNWDEKELLLCKGHMPPLGWGSDSYAQQELKRSHLISFTGVVEQAVCSHSSGVFTSKVNPRHGIYSLKTVPISFPHDQKYSQHWQFLTTCKEKAGCGGHACHPSFSQRWVGAMSLGLLCAQPVFHITFGISLMIPELRSAGCLRKGEPTRIRNRASPFLAAQSSLARGMYWDCGDLNPFKASWQQILSESGHTVPPVLSATETMQR